MKTLVQTILPRIALLQGAADRAACGGNIYAHGTYMMDWWRQKKHAFTVKK